MSPITTHVLDLTLGRPASGVPVRLEFAAADGGWVTVSDRVTDHDGRIADLIGAGAAVEAGRYRLTFGAGEYFRARGDSAFYPEVPVVFEVRDPQQRYHVPLLLSRFGYSTYRGS